MYTGNSPACYDSHDDTALSSDTRRCLSSQHTLMYTVKSAQQTLGVKYLHIRANQLARERFQDAAHFLWHSPSVTHQIHGKTSSTRVVQRCVHCRTTIRQTQQMCATSRLRQTKDQSTTKNILLGHFLSVRFVCMLAGVAILAYYVVLTFVVL